MRQHSVNLALIGAGNRGSGTFGRYALEMPHRAKFVAVVEPDAAKRESFARAHRIAAERQFASMPEFFSKAPADIQGVVIATMESDRLNPVVQSMEKGWHILIEKPLSINPGDLIRIYDATANYDKIVIVCHQMRLTPIYKTIKELIDSGDYGKIVCVQHSENVSWYHTSHSFVRGYFNKSRLTPILLAKSCHDLDLLVHITGLRAKKVASFGSLNYFRKENCPPGAPEYCLHGCPHSDTCPYDVLKIYFNDDTDPALIRQMGVVENKEQLRELLLQNRYGKCVFQGDNTQVDNQVMIIDMEDGVSIAFTMCGHNGDERRITKISMTNGEIEYTGMDDTIRVTKFEPHRVDTIKVHAKGYHGGGDRAIMENFVHAIVTGDQSHLLTPIKDSLEGHLLVFAAEEARHKGAVIDVREYESSLRDSVAGQR